MILVLQLYVLYYLLYKLCLLNILSLEAEKSPKLHVLIFDFQIELRQQLVINELIRPKIRIMQLAITIEETIGSQLKIVFQTYLIVKALDLIKHLQMVVLDILLDLDGLRDVDHLARVILLLDNLILIGGDLEAQAVQSGLVIRLHPVDDWDFD